MADADEHGNITHQELVQMDADVKSGFRDMRKAIGDVRETLQRHFDNVDGRLRQVDGRLGEVERRLTLQTRRLSDLDQKMEQRFDKLGVQIGGLDQRVSAFLEAHTKILQRATARSRRDAPGRLRRRRS
jgi:hypothetical protein